MNRKGAAVAQQVPGTRGAAGRARVGGYIRIHEQEGGCCGAAAAWHSRMQRGGQGWVDTSGYMNRKGAAVTLQVRSMWGEAGTARVGGHIRIHEQEGGCCDAAGAQHVWGEAGTARVGGYIRIHEQEGGCCGAAAAWHSRTQRGGQGWVDTSGYMNRKGAAVALQVPGTRGAAGRARVGGYIRIHEQEGGCCGAAGARHAGCSGDGKGGWIHQDT